MRNSNLSDDFITITQKLMLARERNEILNIVGDYTALIERLVALENQGNTTTQHARSVTTIIKYTHKEIQMMSVTFKKEFIANGLAAHVIKKESGRNSYCYEIRYRSNGYNIIASSTNLAEAKRKFLAKTMPGEIEKYRIQKRTDILDAFEVIFESFYSQKAKTKVTAKTLEDYRRRFNRVPKEIKEKSVSQITTLQLSEYMSTLSAREYEDMRTMFNATFKHAMLLGVISTNPVALVPFQRADRQVRDCLSSEEIQSFLERINEPRFDKIRQQAYFYYFFGLRASELDEETRREGNFLITRNRKRKNGKIEYKKIPIPKQAQGLIDWTPPLHRPTRAMTAGKLFQELLNGKTAYSLRHTFSTICQQYVRQEIVEIWIGDSPTRLIGKHYTHFPDEFLKNEMDKVIFPTLEKT